MTATIVTSRHHWRQRGATATLGGAVVALGTATWSAVRMTWFLRTSPFCEVNPCTAAAAQRSFESDVHGDLLPRAHDAATAAGVPFLDLLYPPILLVVLVVVAGAFWVGVALAPGRPTRNRAVRLGGGIVAAMLVVLVVLAPTTLAFASWMLE